MEAKMEVTFLLFISLFCLSVASENVPVVMWSSEKINVPTSYVGHTTPTHEFNKQYLEKISQKGHNIVAFLQDHLSVEDLAHSAGKEFTKLKELVSKHPSVQLGSVSSPADAVNTLTQTFSGKVHQLKAPYDIDNLDLDPTGNNLIVAELPSEGSDDVVGSVSDKVKALGKPFTAVFTGKKPSKDPMGSLIYTGRHLLQAAEDKNNFTFVNTSCVYMYIKSVTLILTNTETKAKTQYKLPALGELNAASPAIAGNKCSNGSGSLPVKYTANLPDGLSEFSFNMNFLVSNGRWDMSSMSMTYKTGGNGSKTDLAMTVPWDMESPKGFSYHCSFLPPISQDMHYNTSTRPKTEYIAYIQFTSFQLQFGSRQNQQFGYPNDCEGFFSIGTLMGLFSMLFLTLIFAFGICMIMNINVMDRFDDPKGKTITVNVNE